MHGSAAVDVDRLPGHEIACGRGEKHHRSHQIGRYLHALDGASGDSRREIICRRRLHLGFALRHAGGDGVHGDAELADFARQGLRRAATAGEFCSPYLPNPPFSSMKRAMVSTPSPARRLLNTKGRVPRMRLASRSMTASEAPTWGARSILLITSRSERVMPGPPLDGILSPAATSMT